MTKKFTIWSVILLSFTACSEPDKETEDLPETEPRIKKSPSVQNTCPKRTFAKSYEDSIHITATYYDCEADWKSSLKIRINEADIYEADSLLEFEFNETAWPQFNRINRNSFQILLELNDRPLRNKIYVLEILDGKLASMDTIPFFNTPGKDIDKDGIKEFIGFMEYVENFTMDNTAYNPLLVYELKGQKFQLDSSATIEVNREVWGDFYGFTADYERRLSCTESWNTYTEN